MQRHRCTHCRNPIRNLAVARDAAGEASWFHPDCWDVVCRREQERYEAQVQRTGLPALIAPYAAGVAAMVERRYVGATALWRRPA